MRTKWTPFLAAVSLAIGTSLPALQAAAPATAQGLITGKEFAGITGTAVANLTNNAKFPNNPDRIFFFPYFEWNATGDIATPPGNFSDNYGGQIAGYFYPPTTGDYVFYLSADDNAVLYLSTSSDPAQKRVIARETVWSNPREYTTSGGASDLTAKDTSQYLATEWPIKDPGTLAAKITLTAGQPYYIEALFKEGTGGDNLSVAVLDPGFTIDSASPIPGQYLSTDRTGGPVSIETQPLSQTVAERGSVTFRVVANGTPPYSYQWRKGTVDILDATNLVYTATLVPFSDNNAQYTVVVTGAEGAPVTSQPATLTVTPDTAAPTVLNSKASPNRTEVVLTFSEPIDPITGATASNYTIASSGGPLNVSGATVNGNQVTLTTAQQTLGTKYTITINGVRDTAATPNTIAANTTSVFLPTGAVMEQNGMIVFEAENYDRNLDGLWVRSTTRGVPSGGASMLIPNGAGGSEGATKLEYDLNFASAGTYYLWVRASADNGEDDSVWIHIDSDGDSLTERPPERDPSVADPNSASLSGFQPQTDFVWTRDSQGGPDPFTIEIPAVGPRIFAIARREDGAQVDKIILTTDANFTPTGFGPPETRQGAPGLPTVSVTSPTAGQTFAAGANISLSANAAGQSTLNISRVQFTANGVVVGEDTSSPFSVVWTNAPAGVHGIRAVAFDEIGQSTTSDSVAITVGSPAPHALLVTGVGATPNASDSGIIARLQGYGWQVTRMEAPSTTTASADGKQLIIVSSTVTSGDVAAKFQSVAVPVIFWEQAVQDDFLTTDPALTTNRGTVAGQTQISVVNTNHPIAAGINLGLLTVTTNAQDYTWGMPNSNAVVIATIAADPSQAVVYAYDKGAILANGTTPAPEKRVLLFSGDNGFAAYTPEALQLFDNAVQWASGIRPITGARIAWISFHTGDNQPSAAAVTAGFTNAADVRYTQLLRDAGHEVTRFRTSGTPDTNVLNTYDLVIISRSVPSGDYQDPPETLAWNSGITTPTIVLGAYGLRQNRLGYYTGNNIPDTAGPIKLSVTDTNHPIFDGIVFDATGTTVNDYAVIATYTNQPQRGISVVTDAPEDNTTILATVGTAGDPTFGGLIIGELKAGTLLDFGTTTRSNVLAGDRLVFLTGSRENAADATTGAAALTSEGAGIFDLTPDGARMFLNAVDYMTGASNPDPEPPTLSITRSSPTQLSIQFEGTLQSTPSLENPNWTTAATTSPHTVSATEPMRFYRAVR
ncbi:MAG TPA: Ig-like domain-containing protein [Verrucomicrobiae bacterium]